MFRFWWPLFLALKFTFLVLNLANILPPMCFDSNTDLWKHLSHFDREETLIFAIWNYRICWLPGNVWASAGKKEIPFTGISNISHCHVPRGKLFGSGQVFPEMDVWEGWRMTSERISKLWGIANCGQVTLFWPISLAHGSWRLAKSKKRPKNSENLRKSKKSKQFRKCKS